MKSLKTLFTEPLTQAPEIFRFFLVAVIGLVVDIAVAYGSSLWLDIPLALAAAFGFACGACVNYALHELWTFRTGARRLSAVRASKYALALGTTLTVRLVAVAVLPLLLGQAHDLTILVLATGVSFGVNYLVSKFMVFRPAPQDSNIGRMNEK